MIDKDDFRRKWGLQRADLQASTDLLKIFILQFLATLLIFHIVRPGFVLTKNSAHASETFHLGAAVVISGIVCVLTFYHPSLRL
jgi:steroid 5-alpha reductase family enzyme